MSDRDKITERHRRARAIVYVRQSSPGQVQNNRESRALQVWDQAEVWCQDVLELELAEPVDVIVSTARCTG
jgi:hypothetical protein